jgi:hypothetical protein
MPCFRRVTSKLFLSTIMVGGIVVGASLVRGGGDEPKAADPMSVLLRRVEALEGRVAQLEKRPPQAIAPYSPLAPSPPEQGRAPENWRPFEFNGQTIYIVPATTNGATQAPPTIRPTSAPSREATKP